MIWLASLICFIAGYLIGSFIKEAIFDSQNWVIMKWNRDTLGFRPVGTGSRVFKEDRITMSIEIDTASFPQDGVVVE